MVVEKGLRRIRDDLYIDARRMHIAEPPRHVPTAPWKRPIGASRDLEYSEVVVNALQPRPDFRRLLSHQANGFFGKDVSVHIDLPELGHLFASLQNQVTLSCEYAALHGREIARH